MLEEYLAEIIIAERRAEIEREALRHEAGLAVHRPGLLRRALAYAFEPLLNTSRARRPASTWGHSDSRIEKYAESRRLPSAPGE